MNDFARVLLDYRPSLDDLSSKFRIWHVEALLNQAADLLEKCLDEDKELRTLKFTWQQFQLDVDTEEKAIALERKKRDQDFHNRGFVNGQSVHAFYGNTSGNFSDSLKAANRNNSFGENEGQGKAGWSRAEQNFFEKKIEEQKRDLENTLANRDEVWGGYDSENFIIQLENRINIHEQKTSLSQPGMPLNLSKPIEKLEKRLERNYRDGYDRLLVAKTGLEIIYGYPQSDFPNQEENLISDLVIWNREAIEWLVSYQQKEQGFTRVVSVKNLLGLATWNNLEDSSNRVPLHIPSDYFKNHINVRLRGIGASIIGDAGITPWTISIGIPKQAVFYRKDDGEAEPINQAEMPLCLLGRVENRSSTRPVEICGLVSLINASPIGYSVDELDIDGNWSIKIANPISDAEKFSNINDLLLEINVVGLPKSN